MRFMSLMHVYNIHAYIFPSSTYYDLMRKPSSRFSRAKIVRGRERERERGRERQTERETEGGRDRKINIEIERDR